MSTECTLTVDISYSATSGGSVVHQVQRAFNGLGQLITEWQQRGAAVNTSTSPKVQYAYSEMASGANHSRLTSITYPSGYVLTYNYSSGLNSTISRLSSLSDSSGTVESYDYLGLGTVVRRAHSQPGVDLTYVGTPADAGDPYAGLDRFGRVVDQKWIKSGTATDRFQYGYDRNSNRTSRDNLVNTAFGELYSYDGFNQLASFDRGTLNGTKTGLTGSASRSQDWDYDALGNWDSLTTDGGSPQTRTHNKQNEITAVSGATTPTFDANGNMTKDETGKQFVYDAWNRLVTVKNSGGTTLKTYGYDGLNRRVSETASGTTTDLFYSANWQVLEEKVGSNTSKRYVWSPVYVDALILRDRDTDANGTLDERLWVQQDANWNVTALVNGSGTVVERYGYDPFGAVTVYDSNYTVRGGGSSYGWQYLHQGGRLDSVSGLYHFRNRDYSATLGRWVSVDPIRFAGGDVNLYGYLGNGPTNVVDPSGLLQFPGGISNPLDSLNPNGPLSPPNTFTAPGGAHVPAKPAAVGAALTYPYRLAGRVPPWVGATLAAMVANMPFAAVLLKHSLSDNPTNLHFLNGSMPSEKIRESSEHKTIMAEITDRINANPTGSIIGKSEDVIFKSTRDLFAALHAAKYSFVARKSIDGLYHVTVTYRDKYDFDSFLLKGEFFDYFEADGPAGFFQGAFFTVVNDLATVQQYFTMIRPFNVIVDVDEIVRCSK